MKTAAATLAMLAGTVWAAVKLVQWVMVQALKIGVLGVALWFLALTVRELMR